MARVSLHRVVVLLSSLAFLSPVLRAQGSSSTFSTLPVFEFHSGFWVNLHHTLYNEAKQRASQALASSGNKAVQSSQSTPKAMRDLTGGKLPPAEQAAWDDAVSYYAANYADKDLLFNNDLALLKNQLEDFEDCDDLSGKKKKSCDAGLPGKITQVLEEAAPVYRAHMWSDHDRANRRWVLRVAPLVEEQGVGISQRLADIYETKWPGAKIRVDVTAYANWAGAYTTLDPLRVTISSTDSRNQGDAALEMLFHEASHGIAEPVQAAITRECRQRSKAISRDLWHALIFYTTGEVLKPLLSDGGKNGAKERSGIAGSGASRNDSGEKDVYVPYALREGLYERGWSNYYQLLTRFWQPYLDNQATFDDAIAHMVSAL